MAEALRVSGDLVVAGAILGATSFDYPAGSIENADVSTSAAISASKCQKSLCPSHSQSGTAVDATVPVHIVKGATATLKHFTCTNIVPCAGAATVTFDLKKNGTTVLAAVVELKASTAAYAKVTGTITSPSLVAGDVLSIVVDASTVYGTDAAASGILAQIDLDEDYLA